MIIAGKSIERIDLIERICYDYCVVILIKDKIRYYLDNNFII